MTGLYHRALGLAWMLLGLASAALFGSAIGLALLNDPACLWQLLGAYGLATAAWAALCRLEGQPGPSGGSWVLLLLLTTLCSAPDLLAFGALHPVFGAIIGLIAGAWVLSLVAVVPADPR